MNTEYGAFWSYTHADDDRLSGYIQRLAERIANEYAVCSANELNVFLDRKSLSWGDAWRTKIDRALGAAPFLIAVVTPSFIKSQECRRELLAFVAESKSRGFSKLLLPILLIDVPDLREDSQDEVLALLARTQYLDWTENRLRAESDPSVMKALNEAALHLMALQKEVQMDVQAVEELAEEESEETIEQVLAEIDALLPAWMDAVDFDPVGMAQWNAAYEQSKRRAGRLMKQRRGISGPYLSVWAKFGQEILPLSEQRLQQAKTYHRATISLDPHVATAVRLIGGRPNFSPLLSDLKYGIDEAMVTIKAAEGGQRYTFNTEIQEFSSKAQQAINNIKDSQIFVDEANEIVRKWEAQLRDLEGHDSQKRMISNSRKGPPDQELEASIQTVRTNPPTSSAIHDSDE